jgi:hypothetical protein
MAVTWLQTNPAEQCPGVGGVGTVVFGTGAVVGGVVTRVVGGDAVVEVVDADVVVDGAFVVVGAVGGVVADGFGYFTTPSDVPDPVVVVEIFLGAEAGVALHAARTTAEPTKINRTRYLRAGILRILTWENGFNALTGVLRIDLDPTQDPAMQLQGRKVRPWRHCGRLRL